MAASFIWAAYMKLFQPIEKLSAMWPWTGQVNSTLVRGTAIADLLIGLGLILPTALRIQPRLSIVAAIGAVILMICASIFHIARGEAAVIAVNIINALLAVMIAWGRYKKAPISVKKSSTFL